MAKIRHNNIVDTVDEVFSAAKDKGIIHLYAEDKKLEGNKLTFSGKEVLHFGTCGYLGLDHHEKLKVAAIEAIQNYGIQFPLSKTYVSSPLYFELEEMLRIILGAPVVVSKNCTLAHLATIPTLVRESDMVILDHLVHSSVQEPVRKLLVQGVKVEMIRHSNMEMLEDLIKKNRNKYRRIWYMADGVYSMYGDFAPLKEMIELADKYEQLYLYVDDAHGSSWAGKHGAGYVMSQIGRLHEKMVLTYTLGKAFGACGGVSVFPNEEWCRKVKVYGGPNTFSVQMEPPILGAAVASAKIHLSDEIYERQEVLQEKIRYCNDLMMQTSIPLAAYNTSPIFFVGTGTLAVSNNLILKLLQDGIYVNLAPFPAVPMKNTGARITVSYLNSKEDIKTLVEKLDYHFEAAVREENQTLSNIRKAFRLPPVSKSRDLKQQIPVSSATIERFESIEEIDVDFWNKYVGYRGMYDWAGVHFLETSFSQNEKPEENWDFSYYVVRDVSNKVLIVTFFITALYKEDMFFREAISRQMEEKRKNDPYYFTSKSIIMGSLFTEGDHMYIDLENEHWKEGLFELLDTLYKEQDRVGASNIIFRDFAAGNLQLHEFFLKQGYVKVDMPEACAIETLGWEDEEAFMAILSSRNKKHFRKDIKNHEHYFDVEIRDQLSDEMIAHAIRLFYNVKRKNYGLNGFDYPDKLFYEMNKAESWEFILLRVKKEYEDIPMPVAICFCQRNADNVYNGMFVGMDYEFAFKYGAYRQALYQAVKRANALKCRRINLGISASIEKKKVGAQLFPKVAYFHARDNYIMEVMGTTMVSGDVMD